MRCLAGRKPQHAHQLQSEEQSNHHHVLDRVLCHPYQTKELLDTPRSSLLKFAPVTVSCKLKKQDPTKREDSHNLVAPKNHSFIAPTYHTPIAALDLRVGELHTSISL